MQRRNGGSHRRPEPLHRHTRHHRPAPHRLRGLHRAPPQADPGIHGRNRRRVQDQGRPRHRRTLRQVPQQALCTPQLPRQRPPRGGRLRVQAHHRPHVPLLHGEDPGPEGHLPRPPLRIHRGLRAHLPLHPNPPPPRRRGPQNGRARKVHPLHLQPPRPRERPRPRRRRRGTRSLRRKHKPHRRPPHLRRRTPPPGQLRQRRRGPRPRSVLHRLPRPRRPRRPRHRGRRQEDTAHGNRTVPAREPRG
mmetsp:Transcript_26132/g.65320  ORF Transcript_26132/g.65320 Transcript_26132/m.65320 type:complete len:247 (-) Transcript_26132:1039-1779(-)